MTKNTRRPVIGLIAFILNLICVILFLVSYASVSFASPYYASIEECVASKSQSADFDSVGQIVYQYENNKQAFVLYNSPSGDLWLGVLNLKKTKGKHTYQFKQTNLLTPNINAADLKKSGCSFAYALAPSKDSVEQYKSNKYSCILTEIDFTLSNGKTEHCYLYLIDKSQQL